jgi:predicted house-cleaning noncanonical NTP pyrophosphatase (MazG superfamily)
MLNVTHDFSDTHKKSLKEEIMEEFLQEKLMEKLQDMTHQKVQGALSRHHK